MTIRAAVNHLLRPALLALAAGWVGAADFSFLPKGFFVIEGEGVQFDKRSWGSDHALTLPDGEVVFSGPIFPGYKQAKSDKIEPDPVRSAVLFRMRSEDFAADVEKRFALAGGGIDATVGYTRAAGPLSEPVRFRILVPVALVAGRNVLCDGKPVAVPQEKGDTYILRQGTGPAEFRIPVGEGRELLLRLVDGVGGYALADCRHHPKPEPFVHLYIDLKGPALRYQFALVKPGQAYDPQAVAAPAAIQAGNLLGQGSGFEVGPHDLNAFYRPSWSENWADPGAQPTFDDQVAHSGRTSLRLNVSSQGRRGLVNENMVWFRPMRLDAAKTYSLSAWMRSDVAGMEATLSCSEKKGKSEKAVAVGTEWARHVLTFTADQFELLNHRSATVAVRTRNLDGHLWVDDVQLEEGGPTGYQPPPVEFGATIADADRLFTPAEAKAAAFTLRWRNNGAQPLRSAIAWELTDYWGRKVGGGSTTAEVPAQGNQLAQIAIPVLPCGYYRVLFTGDGALRDEAIFGIYQPLARSGPLPPEWPLGGDNSEGTPINRALGFGWTRDWSFSFERICPAEGTFNWAETDIVVERCAKAGLNLMPVMGPGMDHTAWGTKQVPRWAVERTETGKRGNGQVHTVDFPRLDAWKAFIGGAVARYKDRVHVWEILNEPNCWYSADEYLPYLQAAYQAAKAADPTCTIVGGCATSDWGSIPAPWTVRLLELGGGRSMDVLSVHMYSGTMPERTLDGGTDRFLAFLRAETRRTGKELPVWHTEKSHNTTVMGYSAHKLNTPAVYLLEPGFRVPDFRAKAEYLIRETLIDACVGKGPFFWFGSLNDELHYAPRVRPYGLHHTEYDGSPCPELPAANGLARMLEGRHLGRELVKLGAGRYAAVFSGPQGVMAALWDIEGAVRLTLPPGLGQVQAFDFFGMPLAQPAPGKLDLGTAPVYLLSPAQDAAAFAGELAKALPEGGKILSLSGGLELHEGRPVLAAYAWNLTGGPIATRVAPGALPAGWKATGGPVDLTCPPEAFTRALLPLELPASSASAQRLPVACPQAEAALGVPPFVSLDALRALLSPATEAAATRPARPVVIDGDLAEWDDAGLVGAATAAKVLTGRLNWQGPLDLSCELRARWDDANLYLGAVVWDDVVARHAPARSSWDSDGIEVFLGLDPASREAALASTAVSAMGPTDVQLLLAPGMGEGTLAVATAWCCQKKSPLGIVAASQRFPQGYRLEAAIPWKDLDPAYRPAAGAKVLFAFQVGDTDSAERTAKTIYWAGDGSNYQSPRKWGVLSLGR